MNFIERWLVIAIAIPLGLLAGVALVGCMLFAIIGWLPAMLALCAGQWSWGIGLLAGWCLYCGFLGALNHESKSFPPTP